jgi:hypothetical protein
MVAYPSTNVRGYALIFTYPLANDRGHYTTTECPFSNVGGHPPVDAYPLANLGNYASIFACPPTNVGGHPTFGAYPLANFRGYAFTSAYPLTTVRGLAPFFVCPQTFVGGHTTIAAYPPWYLGGHATICNRVSSFLVTNYRIGEEKDEKWICNDEGSLMSPLVSVLVSSPESELSAADSKPPTTQWGLHHCKSKIVSPKILKKYMIE